MQNNNWDDIISEEVENMVCRLRDRGVNADRFVIEVKGQKRVDDIKDSFEDFDDEFTNKKHNESIEVNSLEELLEQMKNKYKNKNGEKYVECRGCGERFLESEIIKDSFGDKFCKSCYNKLNNRKSEFFNHLRKLIDNSTDFDDFMRNIHIDKENKGGED